MLMWDWLISSVRRWGRANSMSSTRRWRSCWRRCRRSRGGQSATCSHWRTTVRGMCLLLSWTRGKICCTPSFKRRKIGRGCNDSMIRCTYRLLAISSMTKGTAAFFRISSGSMKKWLPDLMSRSTWRSRSRLLMGLKRQQTQAQSSEGSNSIRSQF